MRTVFRGQTHQILTAGRTPGSMFSSVQAALDSINDSAPDNRYLIAVQRDRLAGFTAVNKSYVTIAGEHPYLSILERDPADTSVGGTMTVGSPAGSDVRGVWVEDLHIIRNLSGGGGAGNPPEAALYIGAEEDYPVSTYNYDDVTVVGCTIRGVHDGIQAFGIHGSSTLAPPSVHVGWNTVYCSHDAETMKGHGRYLSNNNRFIVRSQGDLYLDDIGPWKTTGFHFNLERGVAANNEDLHGSVTLSANVYDLEDGTNVGSFGQDTLTAIHFYVANPNLSLVAIPTVDIIDCRVRVRYDRDYSPARGVAGIGMTGFNAAGGTATNVLDLPLGRFRVQGGMIFVDQQNTGSNAPTDVAGIYMRNGITGSRTIEVCDTRVLVRNAKGSSNAWASAADDAGDAVEGYMRTEQASTGTLTEARINGITPALP